MVARRLLAQSYIEVDQLKLAEQIIRQAIARPDSTESSEIARLYFILALVKIILVLKPF